MSDSIPNRLQSCSAPLQRQDISSPVDVDRVLLRDIFHGKFNGGDRLIEQDLAKRFGISRTPIREALMKLAGLGLIEMRANRGAVVLSFGRKQLLEMYDLRRILETAATRLACGHIPIISLESLYARTTLLDKRSGPEWSTRAMALDRRLHDLIARHCGNERLAGEINRYNNMIQAVRDVVGNQAQAQRLAVVAHKKIIESLLANDVESSAKAMEDHIEETANVVGETIFPETTDAPASA